MTFFIRSSCCGAVSHWRAGSRLFAGPGPVRLRRGFRVHRSDQLRQSKKTDQQAEKIPGIPYQKLKIGVPREVWPKERRVALTPSVTALMVKKGFTVVVEENAGSEARFPDDEYSAAGGQIASSSSKAAYDVDIVLKVRQPIRDEVQLFRDRSTLVSFLYPAQNRALIDDLTKKQMTAFAMDCIPRISRAQVFDALSSMANVAGYRGVVEAAQQFGRFFAGKISKFQTEHLSIGSSSH